PFGRLVWLRRKMTLLRLALVLAVWWCVGCVSLKYHDSATTKTEADIRSDLLGQWYQEELLDYGESRRVNPVEYEYLPDGTFIYRVFFLVGNGEQRTEEYRSRWSVSGAKLIQEWPRIGGNPPQTTKDTILHIAPNVVEVKTDRGVFYRCHRQPKIMRVNPT
ncbi:MAG: hypothetical protein ABI318_01335, partial [Chthoniobacteraceae bacterium]